MRKRKNIKSKTSISAKSNKPKREKPNAVEILIPSIFLGMMVVKKIDIAVFIDESKRESMDELNVLETTFVNGIKTSQKMRVFWSYDKEDWIEMDEEIVEDMYPSAKLAEE